MPVDGFLLQIFFKAHLRDPRWMEPLGGNLVLVWCSAISPWLYTQLIFQGWIMLGVAYNEGCTHLHTFCCVFGTPRFPSGSMAALMSNKLAQTFFSQCFATQGEMIPSSFLKAKSREGGFGFEGR